MYSAMGKEMMFPWPWIVMGAFRVMEVVLVGSGSSSSVVSSSSSSL